MRDYLFTRGNDVYCMMRVPERRMDTMGCGDLAEGSWKGMKKFLEKDRLCEALQGRVQYDYTWYPAFGGNSGIYTILLDRKVVKKFGTGYA